ncbi:MAG: HdeD family acid-resistance protein [Proteobacteria bacterium]|uniref:HdeD family acid-resistance protein n=1 Tax=Rudaea sp. TaxID=2136325 RepID=UPI00322063DC|nr:HdeD family acid-resistance protein [Pseudomonadota bacterium]
MNTAAKNESPLFQDALDFAKANWWMFLLGGVLYILFGIMALMRPVETLLALSVLFACFVLVDGIVNVIRALGAKGADGRWWVFFAGLLSILVGLFALLGPVSTALLFVFVVAYQAILFGVATFMFGVSIRKAVSGEWVLYVTGILSVVFGLLLLLAPGVGGLSLSLMIGAWALAIGILRVLFAFRVRSLVRSAKA